LINRDARRKRRSFGPAAKNVLRFMAWRSPTPQVVNIS